MRSTRYARRLLPQLQSGQTQSSHPPTDRVPLAKPLILSPTLSPAAHALESQLVSNIVPGVLILDDDFASGDVVGVEALARWSHLLHGVLSPADLLPAIEACDELSRLVDAIMASAVKQAVAWKKHARRMPISINRSLSVLGNRQFCKSAFALVNAHGIAPQDLAFEILETAALTDVGRTLETMTRLRLNGFGLAIDDFGTGFSSFEQLSSIPFTELKIDRSFVMGVATSPRQAAVVRSCVELAHRLNLKVVAEGVETQSDWDFLVTAGATEAQGYYLSRPMPGAAVAAWVDAWPERIQH